MGLSSVLALLLMSPSRSTSSGRVLRGLDGQLKKQGQAVASLGKEDV